MWGAGGKPRPDDVFEQGRLGECQQYLSDSRAVRRKVAADAAEADRRPTPEQQLDVHDVILLEHTKTHGFVGRLMQILHERQRGIAQPHPQPSRRGEIEQSSTDRVAVGVVPQPAELDHLLGGPVDGCLRQTVRAIRPPRLSVGWVAPNAPRMRSARSNADLDDASASGRIAGDAYRRRHAHGSWTPVVGTARQIGRLW